MAEEDPSQNVNAETAALLSQCRKAHQDLLKCARQEEALLAKLASQVELRPTPEGAKPVHGDAPRPEGHAAPISRGVEEASCVENEPSGSPERCHVDSSDVEPRASFGSAESKQRRVREVQLDSIPSETAPQYKINGIDGAGRPVVRNGLMNMVRSTFSSGQDYKWKSSGVIVQCVLSMTVFLDRLWSLEEPRRRGCLARLVRSTSFSMVSGSVILLNACFILYTTELEMINIEASLNTDSRIKMIELALASIYVVEVILKLMVHRLFFFWNVEMAWNWFDFVLVVFSIFENLLVYDLLPGQDSSSNPSSPGSGVNLGFLRLIRLCKIVKILRVFRTLKFFSELRLMLDCVLGSLINVFWCVVMLAFVMYVFGLLLQQGIVQYLMEAKGTMSQEANEMVMTYFGSVGQTVVTLFQSSTSGVDWNEPYKALRYTGEVMPMAFLAYVAFVFISVWNIVTSTFVEKALKLAQPDVDMLILEQQLQDFEDCKMLSRLFKSMRPADDDGNERIGMEEFRQLVETYEFRSYLQTRGIDIKNAETFFKMLVELQGEPMIDATTFANACVRMKGAATSIDLQTVMFTTHLMNQEQRSFFQQLKTRLTSIETTLNDENEHGRPSGEESGPLTQYHPREPAERALGADKGGSIHL